MHFVSPDESVGYGIGCCSGMTAVVSEKWGHSFPIHSGVPASYGLSGGRPARSACGTAAPGCAGLLFPIPSFPVPLLHEDQQVLHVNLPIAVDVSTQGCG